MKYSLCIEPLFTDLPFYERFQVAKELGCDAVEFWDPWVSKEDVTPEGLGKASADAGIPIAAACLNKAWTIRMTYPWEAVKENLELSFGYAKEMGCKTMIGLSGDVCCKTDTQKMLLMENLKRAAEICEKHDMTIVIEALNTICNHKGYYLDSSYVGFEIMRSVNSPRIKLLYDCYHMQIMEGNLVNNITQNIDFIGHFHSASVPGRNELQLGETNYPRVIKTVEELGYDRYFGLEYWPTYDHKESLKDVLAYLRG